MILVKTVPRILQHVPVNVILVLVVWTEHVSAKMDTQGINVRNVSLPIIALQMFMHLACFEMEEAAKCTSVLYITFPIIYCHAFCIGPTNAEMYPSLAYPLILFPQPSFQGNPVKVSPNVYHEFAKNAETKKSFSYLSARILFTRTVSFSRDQENDQVYEVSPGSDIQNLQLFFASNMDFGTPLWFNYATTIDSVFYIKVADNSQCTNCNEEGGSCYTGQCVCLPGYNGTFCEQKI